MRVCVCVQIVPTSNVATKFASIRKNVFCVSTSVSDKVFLPYYRKPDLLEACLFKQNCENLKNILCFARRRSPKFGRSLTDLVTTNAFLFLARFGPVCSMQPCGFRTEESDQGSSIRNLTSTSKETETAGEMCQSKRKSMCEASGPSNPLEVTMLDILSIQTSADSNRGKCSSLQALGSSTLHRSFKIQHSTGNRPRGKQSP